MFNYGWSKEKPFEDGWRHWVKKVSKLSAAQALEQLTISVLARHGETDLENHLRFRALLSWQDVLTQVEKYVVTIYCQHSQQPMNVAQ